MLWLIVGSASVGLLQAGFGYLWKVVMDTAVTGDAAAAGRAMLLVGVGQSVLYMFVQGTRTWMNAHIQRVARDRVYVAMLAGNLQGLRSGDLVTRLTDDLSDEKLAWFLCSGVFRAVEAVMVVLACTATMFWIAPGLTFWSLAPLPLLFFVHRRVGGRVTQTSQAVQEAISKLGSLVHDAFTGVRVIQSSRLEPLAERSFSELASAQADAEVRNTRAQQLFFAQFAYGWQFALAVLLLAGGVGIRDGSVSVAAFASLSGFLMTMVFQMFDFGAFVVRGRQAAASLRRLQEIVDLPVVPRPSALPPGAFLLPELLIRPFLTLEIPGGLRVEPGSFIAITGSVGVGKSTLLAAIAERAGVAAPAAAWVPQEPALFSVSLEENIRLGAWGEGLLTAMESACLGPDLQRMPDGARTRVGERGVTLSGGQQQRVQIARALFASRSLLLLDDATSALDASTEGHFWDGLRAGSDRPMTVLASTHRVATLARADQVLWLRRVGARSVARVGTHEQLLEVAEYSLAYGTVPMDSAEVSLIGA